MQKDTLNLIILILFLTSIMALGLISTSYPHLAKLVIGYIICSTGGYVFYRFKSKGE